MPPSPEGREVNGLAYQSTLETPLLLLGWKNFGKDTELAKLAQEWTDWRVKFWSVLPKEEWATWPLALQQEAKEEVNVLVTAFKSEKAKWKRAGDLKIGLGTPQNFMSRMRLQLSWTLPRVYRSHAVNAAIASLRARVNPDEKSLPGFAEWRVSLLQKLQPWMYTQDQSVRDKVPEAILGLAADVVTKQRTSMQVTSLLGGKVSFDIITRRAAALAQPHRVLWDRLREAQSQRDQNRDQGIQPTDTGAGASQAYQHPSRDTGRSSFEGPHQWNSRSEQSLAKFSRYLPRSRSRSSTSPGILRSDPF